MPGPRTVSVLAPPGVQLTDVAGPLDVFAEANARLGREAYRLEVVATAPGPVRSSSGVRLLPDRTTGVPAAPPHTLLVAGAPGWRTTARRRRCWSGCGRKRNGAGGTGRSVAGRSCWPRPGCSTAAG
ncbi:MAG TPA: hypothetical protein VH092_16275 [Urbifossiella sp.]|nr:hypothetical protein [Urbifossiella sp.]